MFTRTIEVNLKHDTKPAFFKKFKAEVLPILKKICGLAVLRPSGSANAVCRTLADFSAVVCQKPVSGQLRV